MPQIYYLRAVQHQTSFSPQLPKVSAFSSNHKFYYNRHHFSMEAHNNYCHSSIRDADFCILKVENKEFILSKSRLASSSPVFEKMFFGLLSSSEVSVSDIQREEFEQMIHFIYTGKVEFKSVLNAWSLVYSARKYLINGLLDSCVEHIEKNLSLSTLLLSYEHAELYNLEELMKRCLGDIAKYTEGVFDTSYHIKPSTWCAVLNEKELRVDEKKLVKFAVRWAMDECDFQDVKCTAENLWKILCESKIAQFLRFTEYENEQLSAAELDLFKSLSNLAVYQCSKINRVVECQSKLCNWLYKMRPCYKIDKNCRLGENDVLNTIVTVNSKVAIFGVAVSTEHQPCDAVDDFYCGGFIVDIFMNDDCNLLLLQRVIEPFRILRYGAIHYIRLQEIVKFEPSANYVIGVRYKNADKRKGLEVLCHYAGNIKRDNVEFTFFNELCGSALRGLSFYRA